MNGLVAQEPEEVPRTATIVPPRPNLGPEPWRDDSAPWLVPVAILVAAGLIAATVLRRRRRRASLPATAGSPAAVDDSPEGRLLALCDRLRATLAARLGPSLRARTTEEVTADPRVAQLLGDDRDRLAAILVAGDRIKFARREAAEGILDRLPEWTAWAASLDARRETTRRQPPSP
ncbi:hypothetical protein [Paludisphaera mucosa]|uniref:Uncharacterized protein n=1 Tax=Paludisphaera mucosa TaxID=3030827 RepID=A0ABT6F9B5_9BACT|nr:hypothetical protein [Paludisphaera mucosa]MDG3004161.1 hypothetical protein [Paludisphaera mucosa]